jgi:hypothetical protein
MKTLTKIFLVLFPMFLAGILISQDDDENLPNPAQDKDYKIMFFEPKDLSRDAFLMSVRTESPDLFINELSQKKWAVRLEVTKYPKKRKRSTGEELQPRKQIVYADIYSSYIKRDHDDPKQVNFEVGVYSKLDQGDATIFLYSVDGRNEMLVDTFIAEIPERNADPGRQPVIEVVTPGAGAKGDIISVVGRNFGSDIDNIVVYLGEKLEDSPEGFKELYERKPLYLSPPNEEKKQELRFHIPTRTALSSTFLYRKKHHFKVIVAGRPTGLKELVILSDNWKFWIASLSIFIIILMYFGLAYILKKFNFWDMILIDKTTNTYSLSRFQALIWTVVLLGSYFYIAISNGLLLGNGTIPDFNPSLIGLLSISYVGMIGANGLGNKKPKNEIISVPPQLSNLFSSGGSIDLARLQLFGFTVIGVLIYLYNLVNTNPLNGLPDLPTTLLGLMGVSQSGYLGGKVIGDKVSVNMVRPLYVPARMEGIQLKFLGIGFTKNTKIMLDEIVQPIETNFVSGTALSVNLPPLYGLGMKKVTLIPGDSSSIVIDDCFEVISVEPNEVPANAGCTLLISISKIDENYKAIIHGDSEEEYEAFELRNTNQGVEIDLPPMLPGMKWLTFVHLETEKEIDIEDAFYVYPMDDSFLDPDAGPPEDWDDDWGEEDDDDEPSDEGGSGGGSTISFDEAPVPVETVEIVRPVKGNTEAAGRRKSPSSATFNVTEFTINP